MTRSLTRVLWVVAACLCGAMLCLGQTQARGILCNDGDGVLDEKFGSDIRVHVGAAHNGALATRSCAAKLSWEKQELVVVASAAQADLDAFGVDFGDGTPAAAFQSKKTGECCMQYQIYSLEKPPRLLRTITGGEFFSSSDVDLDGRIEIWTDDAAAVNGFEGIALGELDSAPSVVFRFENGKLVDVSAEFQAAFDEQIRNLRSQIRPQDVEEFKQSDGKLATIPALSPEGLHRLRMVKIKVLEIAWAFLYSGRERDVRRALAEMWPPADLDRIAAAVGNLRGRGIHSQAEATSSGVSPLREKKRPQIVDASAIGYGRRTEVVPPREILVQISLTPDSQSSHLAQSETLLDLVIDAAGKVRSAEPAGKSTSVAPELIRAALGWKFIPASKNGRPVASRLRLGVSPRQ